jgi:hypothetical protein
MCGADKVRFLAGALLTLAGEIDRFAAPRTPGVRGVPEAYLAAIGTEAAS